MSNLLPTLGVVSGILLAVAHGVVLWWLCREAVDGQERSA